MHLQFLGTGAADWDGEDERGERRRFTSTLINGRLLMDATEETLEVLPNPPEKGWDIVFTHSHADHFSEKALAKLAPCRVFAHKSWAGEIRLPGVSVTGLSEGVPFTVAGCRLLPFPANHTTPRAYETTLNYVVEDASARLLYMTDTGWPLSRALDMIDRLRMDGMVCESTVGDAFARDWRLVRGHMSLPMVRALAEVFRGIGLLVPDAPVYLTHLARTLHPDAATLSVKLTAPYFAAYDGMTADIRRAD